MHWISARPCMIKDHVQAVGASPAEQEQFRARAMRIGRRSPARATQLRRAESSLANFCIDKAGRYLGPTSGVNMSRICRHWRDLFAAGRINEAEYVSATFQQFYKTPDEFAAPFRDAHSPVSNAGLGLGISHIVTPCPYAADTSTTATPRLSPKPMCRHCAPGRKRCSPAPSIRAVPPICARRRTSPRRLLRDL